MAIFFQLSRELHIQDEMFDDFTPPIKNNLANKNNQFQETPLWAKEDPNARQMQPYNNTNENEAATMMAAVYAETRKPGAQDNQVCFSFHTFLTYFG